MISSKYWHSRLVTDPSVIGKTMRVNNVIVTIVGVLSPDYSGIQNTMSEAADIGLPLALEPQLNTFGQSRLGQPTSWWLQVLGRLKPGVTAAQVQGNLEGVFQQTARAGLDSYMKTIPDAERGTARNRNRTAVPRLRVDSASRGVYDVNTNELRMATILSVVVALVLLIVCANVANLLLSRAAAREREISVRLSLGATRGRLIRQLLTESLLLAFLGGALGLVVGYWGKQLLPGPAAESPLGDWRVLAFVTVVTAATGILFGIAPALRASRGDMNSALKQSGRSVVGTRSVLGRSLIIVQVAISLVLLVGSGLFLRTLHNLRQVDVGFNPHNLLLFRVSPVLNRYDEKRTVALYGNLMERVAAVPGVRAVALTHPSLLSGGVNSTSFFVQGRVYANPDEGGGINRLVVSPNFFEVMEIPILAGRSLTPRDNETAPKVAIINETAAKKFFPGENPLGRRFGSSIEQSGQIEIVGISRDTKYSEVREPAPPTMYVPYFQTRALSTVVEVRTAGDPATVMSGVREAIKQVDPNLPMTDVSTQLEQVERRLQQEKMFASAYTLFGGLAVLLAAIGLFGLMS
ncbi:MAG TPA: ABC transporter permease, partial [Vicinamibacterales bacterium]|nr:ABC transporter permease [Vicinamibacterales bacterium]